MKRWRLRFKVAVVIASLFFFCFAGFVSNYVSASVAERCALRQVVGPGEVIKLSKGDKRKSMVDTQAQRMARYLDEIGAKYILLPDAEFNNDPYPTVDVSDAKWVCPYMLEVSVSRMSGPKGGYSKTVRVVSFFGIIVWTRDEYGVVI